MDEFIFLVGKSDPHLESIHAIRTLGYKVGIFHDNSLSLNHADEYDLVVSLAFDNLAASLRNTTISVRVAGLVCTYENYVTAKAKIATHFGIANASLVSAQMSTDKFLMRQAFMNADPSITPRFEKITSEESLLAFAATTTYPLFIKPTNLVKSLLVLRCDNETALRENFTYAQKTIMELYEKYNIYDKEPELIVEEGIRGKSCSIAAFVDKDGVPHFCEGIVGITSASEHGANDNYLYKRELPLSLSPELSQKLFAVARKGIEALSMRATPAHVELMYDDMDVKIIEIGARIGGYRPRMYGYSYGLELAKQEVRLALGERLELIGTFRAYSAVFELFPDKEGAFKEIVDLKNNLEYTYVSIKPKEGTRIGPAKNGYKAAAVVIVTHKDKQTFEALCKSVDTLKVEVL